MADHNHERPVSSAHQRILPNTVALAVCVLPLVMAVAAQFRPFVVRFYDPEAAYFLNSLRLLRGLAPVHIDHPGTPVQTLGAAMAWALGSGPLDIQPFLRLGYALGMLGSAVGLVLVLRTLYGDLPPLLGLAGGLGLLTAPTALAAQAVWRPELFMLGGGCLALAALWTALARQRPGDVFAAGAAVGLCCALKFLFLPWVIAGLLAVALGWERRRPTAVWTALGLWVLGVVAAFLVATLPVLSQYPVLGAWLWQLLTRTGPYGAGAVGVPEPGVILERALALVLMTKAWTGLAAAGALAAVCGAYRLQRERASTARRMTALAVAGLVAVGGGWLLTLKSPMPAPNYLLPAGVAAGLLFAVALHTVPRRTSRRWQALLCAAVALVAVKAAVQEIGALRQRQREARAWNERADRFLADMAAPGLPPPTVVFAGRPPVASYALRLGNHYAGNVFGDELDAAFPREGIWSGGFFGLPVGVAHWDVLLATGEALASPQGAWLRAAAVHVGNGVHVVPSPLETEKR